MAGVLGGRQKYFNSRVETLGSIREGKRLQLQDVCHKLCDERVNHGTYCKLLLVTNTCATNNGEQYSTCERV